jgi:hypothetical protein
MSERAPVTVSIDFHCSRKNKDYPVSVPLAEAQAHVDLLEKKLAIATEVGKILAELDVLPDCVVLYKRKIVVLANVHESNDSVIGRLLNDVIQRDEYPTKEPKPRKRKAKVEEASAPVEDGELDVEVEDE